MDARRYYLAQIVRNGGVPESTKQCFGLCEAVAGQFASEDEVFFATGDIFRYRQIVHLQA